MKKQIKTIADLDFDIRLENLSAHDYNLQFEDFKYYLQNTFSNRNKQIRKGRYSFIIKDKNITFQKPSFHNFLYSFIFQICLELSSLLKGENLYLDGFKRINDFKYEVILSK